MEYNLAGFNGQRPDPVSGHYHLGNGYRACNPALRRFTAPDSWSPFGAGGLNPYAWCAGDPVNRADPSGHFSLGQGIGMALGFVAGIALSILTEGAAMPVALTLMATVGGDAAIGAGAELTAEAIDGQHISWGQVGIAAGLSAVASLAGFGLGRFSKLKESGNRPFSGLMTEGESMDVNASMLAPGEIQINLHPDNATPVQFYKGAGIEVRYERGRITHTRVSGFTSDFNGKGEPGLILHRSPSDKLRFTLGSAATIDGVLEPRNLSGYSVENMIDYFHQRNIDLKNISKNKPLHLVACSVGGKDGAAQMLANTLRRDVIAYGSMENVYHEGLYPIGNGRVLHERSDALLKPMRYRPLF